MDICFVPSLLHLACVKIITVLLDNHDADARWETREENYYGNTFKIKEHISKLLPYNHLRVKLESFITPILCEIEKWADICEQNWIDLKRKILPEIYSNRQCWLSDGRINREKAAEILIKNSDISSLNRFAFACTFCKFQDVLDLWNNLWELEKTFLRKKYLTVIDNPDFNMKMWIEWLDNSINKDWESFTVWTFQTGVWKNNVYIMKCVLETSSPVVKGHYSLEAFHRKDISIDVKRFSFMIMSADEREKIVRESPMETLQCFLPWPMRSVFVDLMDNLWPYVTTYTFCSILCTILNMIKSEEKDYVDLLVILKNFWKQSPSHCKKAAEKDSSISRPLNFVIKYDFIRQFSRRRFLNCYKPEYNYSMVNQITPFAEFLRNDSDEEYLFIDRMFQ